MTRYAIALALSAGPAFAINLNNCTDDAANHPDCPRAEIPAVPLPPAALLLGLGIGALAWKARPRRDKAEGR